ncbi:MAG: glucoamylase family protein, partial [Candidatus Promineifilaceae bacterium]
MPPETRQAEASTTGTSAEAEDSGQSIRQLAEEQSIISNVDRDYRLLESLEPLAEYLDRTHRTFSREAQDEKVLSSHSAEWVLDNYYIVQEAMRQINKDLKRSYYRELPKLSQGKWARFPRVYVIARAYVKRQSAQVRTETLKRFTSAYQETQPLSTGELWAIPTMLRICVLQTLAGTLSFVRNEPAPFAEPPVQPSPELPAHTLVGNCILSLRAIADQDWKDFYEDVSLLEKTLLKDPAGVYGQMDFATRDHYRKAVEKLSKETDFSELEIAQMVVALARQGATSLDSGLHERQHHVGYYLIDAGQYELQEKLAYRPGLITRIHRWFTRDHPTFTFLGGISLLTLFLLAIVLAYGAAVGASHGALILIAVLVLVPALSLATSLITALLLTLVRPYFIPKLDYKDGVPENRRTMVVVPCLIAREEDVDNLFSQLELHHLRNNSRQITFALLSDFADAAEKDRPEDETLLLRANEVISALNKRYPGSPFYFFHRERLWNEQEGVWMGWERKRGKLEEFNKLLRGNAETSYTVQLGDLSILPDVRYVITLDADTILPLGAGQRLIGALAHPLNRAHFNDDNGRVSAGYTVLQPRIEIEPISGYRTRFSRIYSGTSGFDLYTNAVSDIYQDLFGEGIYVGKGIYEVDPFVRSLEDRTPENILLSHDLFEGIHGRAGLVSDITLYEEYPPDYLIFAQRRHRWIRGDWQLLPWLEPRVFHREHGSVPNTLSAINLWKVIDNLRRSLLPIALLALLVAGWLWLPGSPLVWTLVAVLASAGALLSGLVVRLIQRMTQDGHSDGLVAALQQQLSRWLLSLTFLPYEALIAGDAITTALVRLFITRKQLLQWTTAANAVRLVSGSDETGMIRREMVSATIIAVLLSGLTGWLNPGALVVALPFLLAWALSPVIAVWLSRPVNLETAELESQQVQYLHRLARMTWRYFEQFMGPEDHWLPPDHFQEHPRGLVAHRTSPTNIGLGLLSTLGAYDMGYISLQELALRLQYTFQTLDRLECHRGHFLNWYDTRTIQPLPPRYVSTVDSGNLAACLLTLQKGCDEMPDLVLPRWERWQGLLDTVAVLRDILNEDTSGDARQVVMSLEDELDALHRHIEDHKDLPEQWTALLTYLATEAWPQIEKSLVELVEMRVLSAEQLHRIRIWTEAMRHALMDMKRRHSTLTPWLPALDDVPAFFRHPQGNGVDSQPQLPEWDTLLAELPAEIRVGEIADVCQAAMMRMDRLLEAMDMLDAPGAEFSAARAWCVDLRQKLEEASAAVTESLATYTSISAQCHELVYGMAFDFLYDRRRNLFRIGYNVDTEQLDPNYYDLLASEARTASLIAIAMGEVPQRHWLMLGRPLRNLNGVPTLISWSGSMFEYLMPILWTRQYSQSLLEQSTRAAVQAQIAYGHQRNVPWGISEAGYYRFDAAMNYQYKSFGVPQLALKRGLEDDLVVSPYASLLALPLQPQAVMENLQRLREIDMRSDYGYYESVDYTEARLALGQDYARVRSLMVHHQGMIFLSLVNTLGGDRMVQRFHSHPHIRSVELLLQERMPNRVITAKDDTATESAPYMRQKVTLAPWDVPVDTPAPRVNYLSNGRYGVLITNAGGGFSRWRDTDLTRWRADTTSDDWGSWIYVQDLNNGKLWSISAQPIAEDIKHHEVTFSAHKVDFKYQVQEITAHTEVTVPPDDDLEIRHVQITNHSSEPRHLRLISYAEVILNGQESDRRHPAFNKLFIEGKYAAAHHALIFTRRPRSSEEKSPVMAHQVVVEPGREWTVSYETDRERFLGRGGSVHDPENLLSKRSELSNSAHGTLDPIMCQAIEIQIPAHSTASVAFLTLAGEDEDDVITLLEKYDDWMAINRAFRRADARSASELRQLELDTASLQEIQKLLSYLLFPRPSMRADIKTLVANEKGQPGLWAYAISGDYPILLARIYGEEDLQLARRLLKGHTFWRNRGLQIDLVFLNEVPGGYNQELQSQLRRLLQRMDSEHWENRRGGIFLLQKGVMSTADQILLQTAARVVVDAQRGPLEAQLHEAERQDARLPGFIPTDATHPRSEDPQLVRPPDLLFDNGWGGFIRSGREYVMYLHAGDPTPAPWINVIANSTFGCLVSESGSGFSWA